jgi:hypothetical protein
MIWQLMQRDLAWKRMRWFTLAVAAFCALWHFVSAADKGNGNPFSMMLLLQVWLASMIADLLASLAQGTDTRFHATLPVTVRQVFLARMFSSAALMWLPFVSGMGVLLAIQCVVIRWERIPGWLIVVVLPVWAVIFALAGAMREISEILAFIVAAAVLLTWRSLPGSF